MLKALTVDDTAHNQSFTMHIDPDGLARSVRVELRYLDFSGKWYVSLWDAEGGVCLVSMLPLIASGKKINDLLGNLSYKEIGSMAVFPVDSTVGAKNPGADDLGRYEILWGDRLKS